MSDMLEYLKWRGDLSFEQDKFNEVDNLIFASLAYINFEGVVPADTSTRGVTLAWAAQQLKTANHLEQKGVFMTHYPELLVNASQSARFKDVVLSCYISEEDDIVPNQFSAIVFSINCKEHYIAFRGTDDNLAGWKEDFLMIFRDAVLAQSQAVAYLNKVAPQFKGRFYLGGHSKGGNLAVYAAAYTSDRHRSKITAIYNNDGPGFQAAVIQSAGYAKIKSRINTFIPKSSVIGMLLEHCEDYKIVASTVNGLLSHDPQTWGVLGPSFVHEEELSKSSQQINEALIGLLAKLTMQQRELFVEALFDMISASGALTLSDLTNEWLSGIDAMIKKYKSMDKETRKTLRNTVIDYFSMRQRILRDSISQSVGALLTRSV
jgi:hypothetical protein